MRGLDPRIHDELQQPEFLPFVLWDFHLGLPGQARQ
jgi:hypothetical protein